jgi:phosphatidylserine decarboxylase
VTRRGWSAARPYVLAPLFVGIVLLLAGRRRPGVLGLLLAGGMLAFFRDPERDTDRRPDLLYAAADGLVREVDEVPDPLMPGGVARRISTFLSLHNVHVNRSPVQGTVSKVEEVGGGYHPALFARSEENRRNRIEISGARGPVVVVQKAGMIARRISTWVEAGESVKSGDRLGLIHLGSRTDVLFPAGSAEPLVGPGDRVRAGLTPLARYRKDTRP